MAAFSRHWAVWAVRRLALFAHAASWAPILATILLIFKTWYLIPPALIHRQVLQVTSLALPSNDNRTWIKHWHELVAWDLHRLVLIELENDRNFWVSIIKYLQCEITKVFIFAYFANLTIGEFIPLSIVKVFRDFLILKKQEMTLFCICL